MSTLTSKTEMQDFSSNPGFYVKQISCEVKAVLEKVQKLSPSFKGIDQVVKNINAIAKQTNLWALNSTIEVTRTGVAGKCFGVISNEIKELAQQTSKAAEEISQNLVGGKSSASDASKRISSITPMISATAISPEASEQAKSAMVAIQQLNVSCQDIDQVARRINSISIQTNFLAFYAIIEAARAGEEGKGFLVLANEVKELANQTSKASEEISQKVLSMHSDMSEALRGVMVITQIIEASKGL